MTSKGSFEYEDVSDVIEYLVRVKAHKFTFDCWEVEDIEQEIRLICLEKLKKYDETRGCIKNYLGTCVDNALRNLKRDNYIRYGSPPCQEDTCGKAHSEYNFDKPVCEKWLEHKQKLQRKKNVRHTIDIEIIGDRIKKDNFVEKIEAEDIRNFLLDSIGEKLRPELKNILSKKRVNSNIKRKVKIIVKKILKD